MQIRRSKARRSHRQAHKTVLVRHGGMRARIDEDIAPLVLETWKAGVETHCSCQDARVLGDEERPWMSGWIQLGFPAFDAARCWLDIVAKHEKGGRSLYNRMTHFGCRGIVTWHWEASPYDAAYDEGCDETIGPTTLDFMVFVYFPRSDVARVVRRLRAHNARAVSRW
jgi:hypothetical protein